MPDTTATNDWVTDLIAQTLERQRQATGKDSALALAEWLATFLWKNNTGVYRLDELETGLLRHCPDFNPDTRSAEDRNGELHVATEVYGFGGHTSLMRQLIASGQGKPRALLTGMQDTQVAATRLGISMDRVDLLEPATDKWQHVAALASAMSRHQHVILHIHPNDVIAALAVRMLKQHAPSTRVLMVNHADHAFSVGMGAVDRVLEISRFGWSLRERRGSQGKSTYIGIPIPQPEIAAKADALPGEPMVLSGGSAYKYKPMHGMSLPSTLRKLLRQQPRLRVTVVGPGKRDWWWWPLRLAQRARLSLSPLMPKDAYMTLLRTCTIYVDSHPLPGGTAFPEALMRGCRVAGMRGLAWGYSPADELRSEDETRFLRQCEALLEGTPEALEQQEQVRARCISEHDPIRVRERLAHALHSDELLTPLPSTIPAPSADGMEKAWLRKGAVSLPSRKECPLKRNDRSWLAHQFAQRPGGLRSRSTWTLIRLALTAQR